MPRLYYNYISLDLNRDVNTPLTEDEFHGLKQDGEMFIDKVLSINKEKSDPMKRINEMYLSKGLRISYLVALIIVVTEIIVVVVSDESQLYVTPLALLWPGIPLSRYLLAYFKTSAEWGHFEISVKNYYRTHNSIVKKTTTYNEYLNRLNKN